MLDSYLFYSIIVVLSSFFAGLAQKHSKYNKHQKKEPQRFFWYISMGILIFVMGFRANSVGVDDLSYLRGYNYANSVSWVQYYSTQTTEVGFYLLYRLVYLIFNDFQWLIIITSAITVYLFYKAIEYESENISLALTVFLFSTTQYFYYFGIIRMGLAVAIVAFAFRYLHQNNKKKFVLMVLIAEAFHYSAIFSLVFLFINLNFKEKLRSSILKIILVIPIAFLSVRLFLYPLITASRYQGYIESSEIISFSFLTSIPFFLLFIFNYSKLKAHSHYRFYFVLFIIKLVAEIFAPIIGIGRMVWYVNLCLCFLLPAIIRVNKDKSIKFFILSITVLYCVIYSYYAYFGESHRGTFMIPYRNIFFDFE